MSDRIKTAFECLHAEESLKSNTFLFLQKEIRKRNAVSRRTAFKKYAAATVSAVIILLSGIFTYNAYFTPAAYLDVDVNPSVELTLNRFDRVIGAHAYNDDGEDIIKALSIKHKGYDDALVIIMEAMTGQGYFQDGELVSVTLQTDDKSKETILLANIQNGIEGYLSGHHHTALLDVFPVSGDTREHSYELGISPAKYLAIQELIEVDSTATIESCRGHSISEIRQLTQEHGSHHGNGKTGGGNESATGNSHNNKYDDCMEDAQDSSQTSGHHGGNNRGNHHGGGH